MPRFVVCHRWRDGTTHVAFEPLELIAHLAALVPPPRFHSGRYHGVLASRSKHRADVVPSQSDSDSPALGLSTRALPISPAQSVSEDWTLEEPKPKRHPDSFVGRPIA